MTIEEIKAGILAYINSSDATQRNAAVRIVIAAVITNAGIANPLPLETNLQNMLSTMQTNLGAPL